MKKFMLATLILSGLFVSLAYAKTSPQSDLSANLTIHNETGQPLMVSNKLPLLCDNLKLTPDMQEGTILPVGDTLITGQSPAGFCYFSLVEADTHTQDNISIRIWLVPPQYPTITQKWSGNFIGHSHGSASQQHIDYDLYITGYQ